MSGTILQSPAVGIVHRAAAGHVTVFLLTHWQFHFTTTMYNVETIYLSVTVYDDGLVKKLQAVKNAAARVTTETKQFDHITRFRCELHWLPVRKRIVYKLAVMVYKCLHGMAPSYLAADLSLIHI